MNIKDILARLAQARVNAGLSRSQAARKMGLEPTTVAWFETNDTELLDLPIMARFCALYDASLEWVLTGVNSNFDPGPIMAMAREKGMSLVDAERLIELLSALRHEPDDVDGKAIGNDLQTV